MPDHVAVANAIPRFVLKGEAFGVLVREATPPEIEELEVILLLLELFEYVGVVNPKSLRDQLDVEWWEEGLCGSLLELASWTDGLDLENLPSFRRLLAWKDSIERGLDDSFRRTRSDSEEIDLPDGPANDAPRGHEILAKRYEERVAAHELAACLRWLTLDGNDHHLRAYQSFREDLRQALSVGTYPFSPLTEGEISDLQIRRLPSGLFREDDDIGDL